MKPINKYMAILRAKFQRFFSALSQFRLGQVFLSQLRLQVRLAHLGQVRLETWAKIAMQKLPCIFCLQLPGKIDVPFDVTVLLLLYWCFKVLLSANEDKKYTAVLGAKFQCFLARCFSLGKARCFQARKGQVSSVRFGQVKNQG